MPTKATGRPLFRILMGMKRDHNVTDIFFDLDHTLWDFEANSAATFDRILAAYHLPFSSSDFMQIYSPINHHYWKRYRNDEISTEQLRFLRLHETFEALDFSQEKKVIDELSSAYIEQLSTFTQLFDGTIKLLNYLKAKYRLHIITNGFEEVQHKKMHNSGIHDYFEIILTAEKAGIKKPHPKIFQTALNLAKVAPHNAMMIGDSYEADIQGALAQGMHAIHFNSHQEEEHTHCVIVDKLETIHNYL